MKKQSINSRFGLSRNQRRIAASFMLVCFLPTASLALPALPQVINGAANISTSGNAMTVTNSAGAIINWQSFSIGQNESARFIQPSAASAVLNRITGGDPSKILGVLQSNGKVLLINPNGILFGQNARVDVGGLIASTLNITNQDFLAGRYNFRAGAAAGKIENQGTIATSGGGEIYLIATDVTNSGVITAPNGDILLAAGKEVMLVDKNNPEIAMVVTAPEHQSINLGTLVADAGRIGMYGGIVRQKGRISADSAVMDARGRIFLKATKEITAEAGSATTASGGTIKVLGDMESGTVRLSGRLDASALNGGDGGFIETSAARVKVDDSARITTLAPYGKSGTWLIDPVDYTIAATGGDITGAALSSNLVGGNITILSSSGTQGGTAGDLNVNDAVTWSANTLTLTAARDININAVMTASGTSVLALNPATANGADSAVPGGLVKVGLNSSGFSGRVDFPGRAGTGFLTIGGAGYYVINSLGVEGDATTTTLQGMKNNRTDKYALGSNINASSTSVWNGGAGFEPVGNSPYAFSGAFDGLGHTISGLTINRPTTDYVGLFGWYVGANSIRNVGLVGSSVIGNNNVGSLVGSLSSGTISNSFNAGNVNLSASNQNIGGLVGYNNGTIINSYNSGNVSAGAGSQYLGGVAGYMDGGTISGSYNSGSVTGGDNAIYLGGLLGYINGGTVSSSYNTGSITGQNYVSYVGGITGYNRGNINYSYNSGSVASGIYASYVGGLVGQNNMFSTISTSFNTGSVTGGNFANAVGGLVGHNNSYGAINDSYSTGSVTGLGDNQKIGGLVGLNNGLGTISNSFATGAVSAGLNSTYIGGLVGWGNVGDTTNSFWDTQTSGQATSVGGTGLTTAQMQTASNFTGFTFTATPGETGNNWVIVNADGSLNSAGTPGGGTYPMLASEYSTTINNAHQLQLMQMAPAASYTLRGGIDASKTGNSTDIWGSSGFVPIGNLTTNFTGTFDGLGHTISNLTITRPTTNYVGLFGAASTGAIIQNVGLVGGSVSGIAYVGDLLGINIGGAINNSYATGNVSGTGIGVGGLVGGNSLG
ncbi:MAG: filamentous hemagglutinin N-terminal domain-containing protein, partial [Desulfuromonadaceae bacterium]|nr:filamentous hemagglutinin N-terminal domain-containing protein [Desulfuromonadaceae bacterium]